MKVPGTEKKGNLRILYWNIQNGMWCDQGNDYNNFVAFVKKYNPDICVWCEAESVFQTGTDTGTCRHLGGSCVTLWSQSCNKKWPNGRLSAGSYLQISHHAGAGINHESHSRCRPFPDNGERYQTQYSDDASLSAQIQCGQSYDGRTDCGG